MRSARLSTALAILLAVRAAQAAPDPPIAPASPAPPASIARAEEEPPMALSLLAGFAAVIVPLAAGGGLIALGSTPGQRNAGVLTIMGGFVLAPILSHAVAREGKRAAVFGALPAACLAAMAVFLTQVPDPTVDLGEDRTRVPFALLLISSLLASTGGLVDSFLAGDRWRKRVTVAPLALRGGGGIAIGGSWGGP